MHSAIQTRFLNYAVSVVTSRALPDVRDGLKPVQRRILYTMYHALHLYPDRSTLKCAKVVGQVLGDYHPHGDSSVYEAMVRLAQPWTMRYPLVFGQGNFGSIDGDGAAAYRYTEAKLLPMAMEFVEELGQDTVDFRPNFDDRLPEPVVLPARVPQLLINGSMGIAVGMATNIPPHNLGEVMSACEALIDDPEMPEERLLDYILGPDFPTGGIILESRQSLAKVYRQGKGAIRVRGTYFVENTSRKIRSIIIDSIPYMVNKASLVEDLGNLVLSGKLPQVVDVRDESTVDVRIVLECQADADIEAVMAYIFKHTKLQDKFNVNMMCLTSEGPRCLSLLQVLREFVAFRHEVTERRLRYEVAQLSKRIHILEGFVRVFDALDEAIQIIRQSDGRKIAAERLMARFDLDEEQSNAVLELHLYALGRKDILQVREELADKCAQRAKLEAILASEPALWKFIRKEMSDSKKRLQDERRTRIVAEGVPELSYQEEDFIVEEPTQVILTRDGWVRRVSMGTDVSKQRLRQDDAIVEVLPTTTLASVLFFTDMGTVYTIRVNDLPLSRSGFGDPVQKFFKFADGERVIAAFTFDSRDTAGISSGENGECPALHGVAAASDGKGLRFSFEGFVKPSTSKGRRFAKVADGVQIVSVQAVSGGETAIAVSRGGRALLFPVAEISFLSGVGRGVVLIKLEAGDSLLDMVASDDPNCGISVVREEGGKVMEIVPKTYKTAARGGKGLAISKRGRLRVENRRLNLNFSAGSADEDTAASEEV
ncbi:DNA topoisomerase IV subunit A [bacterium]|nr:DNA topoisomerase IV subunit A [bacterium]